MHKRGSIFDKVSVDLPLRDSCAVASPLLALGFKIFVENMVAEHLFHERACGEELCRLFEGLGQGVYSRRGTLVRSHVIDIGVSRRGNGQVALDAVETAVTLIEAQATKLPCLISDTVSRYAKQNDNVEYASLSLPASEWAKHAQRLASIDRESVSVEKLIKNYDINETAKQLEKIYEGTGVIKC